jgi:hypothetical protein
MTGTALINYEQRWEQDAKQAAQSEPLSSGSWLTARGGQLVIDDNALPGNQAAVIVLDSVRENTYYGVKYDPENPLPPVCYAIGRDADPMFPHTDMQKDLTYFKPQHWQNNQVMGCEGCPLNEWGSAPQGRGKACQNRRRLTIIPAGYYQAKPGSRDFDLHLFDDTEHYARADLTYFKLPVTSVSNWSKYVNQLSANVRRPPWGVVTRIHVEPHAKHQYEVCFELIDTVPDELAETIINRHDGAVQMPLAGYQAPDPERLTAAQGAPAGGFRQQGFQR